MRYQVVDESDNVLLDCERVKFGCGIIFFYRNDTVVGNIKEDTFYYISQTDHQWHDLCSLSLEIRGVV